MTKITLSKGISLFPMPAAVISVGVGDEANLITLAYVGKVCMHPPIIAISIMTTRYSYKIIEKHGEFVLNYPTTDQIREMDYCGTRSGMNVNKWEELNLTKEQGVVVKVPMIKEFLLNMECKVVNKLKLGSHVCYFGEVVATHSDSKYVTEKNLDPEKLNTFGFIGGNYIKFEKKSSGEFGFSLK
ncbi:MAG: flavin reductase family protein [Promethearchaeota archaeon]